MKKRPPANLGRHVTTQAAQPQWPGSVRFAGVGLLLFAMAFAAWIRVQGVYDTVFTDAGVLFHEADPWCHMRSVDNVIANFPYRTAFDPYMNFPGGALVPVEPLLNYLIAALALVLGAGSPSPRLVDTVGAWVPVVLGVLTIPVAFRLGTVAFGRAAGLLTAVLVAVCPGNFLRGSLIGYTDHHVAEALLTTLVILFCALSIKSNQPTPTSSGATPPPGGASMSRPCRGGWRWAIAAGFALGLYMLTWRGGALFCAPIVLWIAVQAALDHLRGRETGYLLRLGLPMFGIALLMVMPPRLNQIGVKQYVIALAAGLALSVLLPAASRLARRVGLGRIAFVCLIAGVAAAGIAGLWIIAPHLITGPLAMFGGLVAEGPSDTINEVAPLLNGPDGWTLDGAWLHFTTGFFAALAAMPILLIRAVRRNDASVLLIILWSAFMLAATLGQNRFSYYSGINVALLSAWLGGAVLTGCGRRLFDAAQRPRGRRDTGETPGPQVRSAPRVAAFGLILAGVLAALVYPNVAPALDMASRSTAPHPDWYEALTWMRSNTPEPFGDANAYLARFDPPPAGASFDEPSTAYGVMSWWDYGYWIMRIGRRIPSANPTQHNAAVASRFFTAQDEAAACGILDRLGARYVVVDALMGLVQVGGSGRFVGKFVGVASWSDRPPSDYLEDYYAPSKSGGLVKATVYYPAFYRSLFNRLYVFRGLPVTPRQTTVLSFRNDRDEAGNPIKVVTALRDFDDYDEAERYRRTLPPETTRLVGRTPFLTCVPLEGLEHFRLIHQSPTVIGARFGQPVSYVEIYERVP